MTCCRATTFSRQKSIGKKVALPPDAVVVRNLLSPHFPSHRPFDLIREWRDTDGAVIFPAFSS